MVINSAVNNSPTCRVVSSIPLRNLAVWNLNQAVRVRTLVIQKDGFLPDGVFAEIWEGVHPHYVVHRAYDKTIYTISGVQKGIVRERLTFQYR